MADVPVGLPVRTNFVWSLAGNVIFAICQWGIIVALARAGSTTMVGQFSLGIAIATPIFMFTNFDLRAVQATDAKREYRFSEYLRFRVWMTAAALLAIGAITWSGGYGRSTALIISAVGLAKGIESLSDVHYGLFQLNGRLDQTSCSMILRGVLSAAAMSVVLLVTHSVLWGCLAMAMAWLAVLALFDSRRARVFSGASSQTSLRDRLTPIRAATVRERFAPRAGARRLWTLARIALPMGIVTAVVSLNLQMPRYFIHARMSDHDLGVFSALAYATIAMTLVGDSLVHCAIPRLSRLYAGRQIAHFRGLLMKLLAIGCAMGVCGLAISLVFGAHLLKIFYGPLYAAHSRVFVLLAAGAAIHIAASMLTSGITSARNFRIQVPLYVAVTAATALGCAVMVPSLGLVGAALGVACGAVMRLILAAAAVRSLFPASGGWA
jgi:O-antigen/teichoic acid export membrane protein